MRVAGSAMVAGGMLNIDEDPATFTHTNISSTWDKQEQILNLSTGGVLPMMCLACSAVLTTQCLYLTETVRSTHVSYLTLQFSNFHSFVMPGSHQPWARSSTFYAIHTSACYGDISLLVSSKSVVESTYRSLGWLPPLLTEAYDVWQNTYMNKPWHSPSSEPSHPCCLFLSLACAHPVTVESGSKA
jgi:hypothetical protein